MNNNPTILFFLSIILTISLFSKCYCQDGKDFLISYAKFKKGSRTTSYVDKLSLIESEEIPFIPCRNPLGDQYKVTSKFGKRKHPVLGKIKDHNGLDLATKEGNKVYSSGAGIIEETSEDSFLGKYIVINHLNGFKTIYGHLSSIGVKKGDVISPSAFIGNIGQTGRCTGPHLHFSVKYKDNYIDPVTLRIKSLEFPEFE